MESCYWGGAGGDIVICDRGGFDGDKCDNGNGNDREHCPTNAKLSDKPDCGWRDRHIDRHVAGFPKGRTTCGEGEISFCEKVLFGFLADSCSRTCSMPSSYDQGTTSCNCNNFTRENVFRTAAIEKTMHKRAWHVKQPHPCTMLLKQQRIPTKLRE